MSRTLITLEFKTEEEQLALFAKALAHPIRLKILDVLGSQSCCFTGDLTELLPLAQSTISQHLKVLKDAGLIQGEIIPPKIKYCINQENWEKANNLFNTFFSNHLINKLEEIEL